jgi:hypothetical protein
LEWCRQIIDTDTRVAHAEDAVEFGSDKRQSWFCRCTRKALVFHAQGRGITAELSFASSAGEQTPNTN